MALTNCSQLANKMSLLRSHGITRDPSQMTHEADGPWYYQQIELGYNYRMTELQAALGVSQITRLDEYVVRRHNLARRYNELLADLPVTLPWQHLENFSSFHLYPICLQLSKIAKTHRQVFESLREKGIGVNLHYIPVYSQPYFLRMGFKPDGFPNAQSYYQAAISLPIYQSLSDIQQDLVIATLRQVLMK